MVTQHLGLSEALRLGLGFRATNLRFFWLGLGYVMLCDVTLACANVRSVILSRELAWVLDRNRSHFSKTNCTKKLKLITKAKNGIYNKKHNQRKRFKVLIVKNV